MTQPDGARPEPGPDAGVDEIRTDIEQTRKELGDTVGALTAKMDVKARAKDKAAETRERVADKAAETRERVADKAAETRELVADKAHAVQHVTLDDGRARVTVPVAAAVVVGIATLVWLLRRRR
jgi:hypothetical protein